MNVFQCIKCSISSSHMSSVCCIELTANWLTGKKSIWWLDSLRVRSLSATVTERGESRLDGQWSHPAPPGGSPTLSQSRRHNCVTHTCTNTRPCTESSISGSGGNNNRNKKKCSSLLRFKLKQSDEKISMKVGSCVCVCVYVCLREQHTVKYGSVMTFKVSKGN